MVNEYGLDVSYIEGKLKLLLRDVDRYQPEEMARALLRLASTADKKVFSEPEFDPKGLWIDVDDGMPTIGQKVILFANGVVQEEIFTLDAHDPTDFYVEYFWSRDDLEDCPVVKLGQKWMPLPKAPE